MILSLSIPKPLILLAKGSGFSGYALKFVKQRVRRGCGLDDLTRSDPDKTRMGG
jgi:hypothetical protein